MDYEALLRNLKATEHALTFVSTRDRQRMLDFIGAVWDVEEFSQQAREEDVEGKFSQQDSEDVVVITLQGKEYEPLLVWTMLQEDDEITSATVFECQDHSITALSYGVHDGAGGLTHTVINKVAIVPNDQVVNHVANWFSGAGEQTAFALH